MFKYFTTIAGKSIAINPLHVMHISEYTLSKPVGISLTLTNGEKVYILGRYEEVISSLSTI